MYRTIVQSVMLLAGLYFAWSYYTQGEQGLMTLMILLCALIVWGYFKNSNVHRAFREIRRENIDKAEALLFSIKRPEKLRQVDRALYHFTQGFIALARHEWDAAFEAFTEALDRGLRKGDDKVIANLNLCYIEIQRGNLEDAQMYLDRIAQFKYRRHLNSDIERIRTELEQAKK